MNVDSSSGHEYNSERLVMRDIDRQIPLWSFSLVVYVELVVEGSDIYCSFDVADRPIYTNVSIKPLIIDVFYHESHLLVY